MMAALRVLIVEDSELDMILLLTELRRAGLEVEHKRVETPEEFDEALDGEPWDAILCDYVMPRFSGPAALEMVHKKGLDVPFLIVSGQIGEDAAVEAMRAGAHDYIMKGNLKRLGPAIERELAEVDSRRSRRQAEQELRRREEELHLARETEKVKDEFIGMVSHELRNPLTAFLGLIQLAREDESAGPFLQRVLREAEQSAVSLGQILDNLIELSRYQANRLSLATEKLDIGAFVAERVQSEATRLDKHELRLDVAPDLPPVRADRIRVQQILRNLWSNAAKYSPDGTVIHTSVRCDGDCIQVAVRDQGPGIAPDDQQKLFHAFQRLEGAEQVEGLGLGLLVCKRLVEAHGGQIWCDSTPGQGSTFTFSLPLSS